MLDLGYSAKIQLAIEYLKADRTRFGKVESIKLANVASEHRPSLVWLMTVIASKILCATTLYPCLEALRVHAACVDQSSDFLLKNPVTCVYSYKAPSPSSSKSSLRNAQT